MFRMPLLQFDSFFSRQARKTIALSLLLFLTGLGQKSLCADDLGPIA